MLRTNAHYRSYLDYYKNTKYEIRVCNNSNIGKNARKNGKYMF
jgi:hypothetical protein